MSTPRRVLVVTVVHHPDDARIRHRQIQSLLDAGWQVTYAAPFADYGLTRPVGIPGLIPVEVPRASGRRRVHALKAARALLRERAPGHDVVLLHDPELLLAMRPLRHLPPVVWDVHEDTAAALQVRPWVPDLLRAPAAWGVHRLERWAEDRMPLLLAEHEYQGRFRSPHAVVPNTTWVSAELVAPGQLDEDGHQRVVYLGSLTVERGARELIEVGRHVQAATNGQVQVHVVGPAHGETEEALRAAAKEGAVTWHGFVPSDRALPMLDGALAGLSLLHDEANFRHSMPTKVIEYLAHGVPAISTPLPVPSALLDRTGAGILVPFRDVSATVDAVLDLHRDPARTAELGRAGHRAAADGYDWEKVAPTFIEALEAAARS
ncbi:glycosyltransferase family 4 protein [Ornithinimicrobium ciconiae]|uniref:Glycosyltransferase family 4 protein n=1 Tax=Ornithinimicrobium ciconiae TaxID=2594265 RepID=A0A516G6E1_9MICO|nr:glycosyltransferase [Ornithinimicrobium ciconiae]QDO87101.1 glycosyltransferase family 4 protein [Ornithinimicrobium ciconiae]